MKKITTIVMLIFTIVTYSQKNLFESLIEYDGQVFKCYDINDDEDGFYITPHTSYQVEARFDVVKNKFGKGVGLTIFNIELDDYKVRYHKHTDKVDHYSQPSKMRVPTSVFFESFVMVDGMLFELRNSNEDLSKYDIHNSFVWVPVKLLKADKEDNAAENDAKKQEDELAEDLKSDKTKKKKFGAFMKDLADKAKEIANASMGASLPTIIKELDSRAAVRNKINNYVAAMRKKQGPYSAQEKIEVAHMKQILVDDNADTKKVNDEYWASDAGQATIRNMNASEGKATKYYLYNASDRTIGVCLSSGIKSTVLSGDKYEWSCGSEAYYCENDGPERMISDGDGVCGQTITIR